MPQCHLGVAVGLTATSPLLSNHSSQARHGQQGRPCLAWLLKQGRPCLAGLFFVFLIMPSDLQKVAGTGPRGSRFMGGSTKGPEQRADCLAACMRPPNQHAHHRDPHLLGDVLMCY